MWQACVYEKKWFFYVNDTTWKNFPINLKFQAYYY